MRLWVNDTGPAADRRLGEVGQRHRVSRVDPPAGRAGLSAPAGAVAGEGEDGVDRAALEAPAPGRRGDPAAEPLAQRVPGDLRAQDAVPARRPQRRLRARHVDLEGVGPGDDRRGDRGGRLRRGPPQGPGRGRRRRPAERAGAEAPRLLRAVRRAGVPAAAAGRAEGVLHRPAVPGEPRPGDGRQAGGAAGPQVAAVPLSRAGQRQSGCLRRGVAALVRAVGLAPRPAAAGRPRPPAGSPAASRSPTRPGAWSPTSAPAPSSASSSSNGCGSIRGRRSPRTPSCSPASTRRSSPTCAARSSCSSTTSSAASPPISASCSHADYLYLNGRLAQALRRRSARRRAVPEGRPGAARAGRRPDPSLPDVELRLHGVELADPSRGLPVPERAGPGAAAAAGGRRPAGRRPPPGPDHPPARRRSRPSPSPASRATG